MIYGSFAICSGYWTSYAICFLMWSVVFSINMYLKDEMSYKHKEGWDKYRKNSYIVLPKFFSLDLVNYVFYMCVALACIVHYYKESLLDI